MGEHRSRSSGTESERTTVSMRVTVGAASAAIPRQRASYWQAPIAAEAAPTRALTRLHKGSHKIISCERCARPTPNLRVWKSRRGSPSGPVAQARRHTGKSPKGAGHGWPAVFAETGCRIGNLRWGADPGRRPLIHGGGSRPPFRVAEAWPRG